MAEAELLKTFNSGIGMIVVVAADRADAIEVVLKDAGEAVFRIGAVEAGEGVRYSGKLV
jgi:phosphoribosylformylglycinamidine cyclo-ligase